MEYSTPTTQEEPTMKKSRSETVPFVPKTTIVISRNRNPYVKQLGEKEMFQMYSEEGKSHSNNGFEMFTGKERNCNRKIRVGEDGVFYFYSNSAQELLKGGDYVLLFWDAEKKRFAIKVINYHHRNSFMISRAERNTASFCAKSFIRTFDIPTNVYYDEEAIYYDETRQFISVETGKAKKIIRNDGGNTSTD
jgi:hypothetical protein